MKKQNNDDWYDKEKNDEPDEIESVIDTSSFGSEKTKTKEDVEEENPIILLAQKTLQNVIDLLVNKEFCLKHNLNMREARKIRDIIKEMAAHGGEPLNGIKSIDGMTMYPCAKHEYAPLSECMNGCEFFDGHDANGVCTSTERRLPGHMTYIHFDALQLERTARKERQVHSIINSVNTVEEPSKNMNEFILEAESIEEENEQTNNNSE